MDPEELDKIYSEDYADLLINYNGDVSVFENFKDATVNIINYYNAIVYVPKEQITNMTIYNLGYSVMPSLFGLFSQSSIESSGIQRIRNIPNFNLRGNGVLIGIIDTGIDYTNPVFQYEDGTTRITAIWDQTIRSQNSGKMISYGTEYTREQINEALKQENPFEVVPTRDDSGHGTMLAGIAGGKEVPDSNFYGVAPEAEFIVVKLKPAKRYLKDFFLIPEDALCYQENDILSAINYIFEISVNLDKPIALCMALGTSQGAHDGRGTLSSQLSMLADLQGIAVVVGAGNEGNARRHYYGTVDPAIGYDTMELNIGENETGFSMEIWGDSPSTFSIDIQTPSGEYVPRIAARLDINRDISFIFEQTEIFIDYQMIESQSGDQLILMRFEKPSAGIWRFRVFGRGDLKLGFHAWLPMEGFISADTYFIRSDPYTTILSLGNALIPITVTAYNDTDDSLYLNSSRGYTRIGAVKPDIAAPGVNITSPTLTHGFTSSTSTSAAAAHTTGVAAMLLEWGIVRGNLPNINTLDIKKLMMRGARRNTDLEYPNRDWGYGILDVFNIFESLRRSVVD